MIRATRRAAQRPQRRAVLLIGCLPLLAACPAPPAPTCPRPAACPRARCPERADMYEAAAPKIGRTWLERGEQLFGAKPGALGPIGGGKGYRKVITRSARQVRTLDQLLAALKTARAGDVIFLPGHVTIDCTVRVLTDKLTLQIPAGVTLASDRGHRGSRGALIHSSAHDTRPLIQIGGRGVRLTGLRIRGPDPHQRLRHHRRSFAQRRGHKYYYRYPISVGIDSRHPALEVDNCELAGWSHSAIRLYRGEGNHIHHNYIHHNRFHGLGYGVSHTQATSLIEHNLFRLNRHAIASTGRPGSGYEARHNVVATGASSHCFDVHGGVDRRDGTNVAGTFVRIHHNTFLSPRTAIKLRGVPQRTAAIHHNWFRQRSRAHAVGTGGNTRVYRNAYGRPKPRVQLR